jgi:cytosol alanyl aminopeptidase
VLRRTVLLLAGLVGDDGWAAAQARAVAERWVADPAGVDADIAKVALEIHGKRAGAAWFESLRARLTAAATPEQRLLALAGLTSIEDRQLIDRLLLMVLDGTIKIQDTRYIFRPLFERRASREVAYRWVTAHFAELAPKLPGPMLARMVAVLGNFCDEARVAEFDRFFRPRLARAEGAEKYLNQAIERARLCVATAAHQAPRLKKRLEPQLPSGSGRKP